MGKPLQIGNYFSCKTEVHIPFPIQMAESVIKIQVKKCFPRSGRRYQKVSDPILEAKSFALD